MIKICSCPEWGKSNLLEVTVAGRIPRLQRSTVKGFQPLFSEACRVARALFHSKKVAVHTGVGIATDYAVNCIFRWQRLLRESFSEAIRKKILEGVRIWWDEENSL